MRRLFRCEKCGYEWRGKLKAGMPKECPARKHRGHIEEVTD